MERANDRHRHNSASKESQQQIDSDHNTNTHNDIDIDPLETMDASIEPATEVTDPIDCTHEPNDDDENSTNAEDSAEIRFHIEPKIHLRPISDLLLIQNVPKSPSIDSNDIVNLDTTDSDSDDDQPLQQLIAPSKRSVSNENSSKNENGRQSIEANAANDSSKPKSKESNKNHCNNNNSQNISHKSNKSDIVVPANFNVMVNLDPLPKQMDKTLKQFNLTKIRDHKCRIVASSKVLI